MVQHIVGTLSLVLIASLTLKIMRIVSHSTWLVSVSLTCPMRLKSRISDSPSVLAMYLDQNDWHTGYSRMFNDLPTERDY